MRVRYAETDRMGVVYHAHYLVWMDIGRTELLRALGHPYEELERGGLLFAVSEARVRLSGSARYGDTVVVRTTLTDVRSRRVSFGYDISVEGAAPVASGGASVVALDAQRRPRRIPEELLVDLRRAAAREAPLVAAAAAVLA